MQLAESRGKCYVDLRQKQGYATIWSVMVYIQSQKGLLTSSERIPVEKNLQILKRWTQKLKIARKFLEPFIGFIFTCDGYST